VCINLRDVDREFIPMKIIETLTFPTDIIEEEWATVRIFERAGQAFCSLVLPREKDIGEERAIRLEVIGLGLYHQKRNEKLSSG
jgi:hypothetical protein